MGVYAFNGNNLVPRAGTVWQGSFQLPALLV